MEDINPLLFGRFHAPRSPPWLLSDCDDNNNDDVVVVAADILPEEALAEVEERRGRQGDAVLDGNDGGISGTEWPGVFQVRGNTGAMQVFVLLPEKVIQTYKIWAG